MKNAKVESTCVFKMSHIDLNILDNENRNKTCLRIYGFSCINIRQVPWEVLKTEAGGRGFQHLTRDLANVNALINHVRSLLLHKN